MFSSLYLNNPGIYTSARGRGIKEDLQEIVINVGMTEIPSYAALF